MRIAINAMGGDHGPGVIVKGALQFCRMFPDDTVILVGDETKIKKFLPKKYDANRLVILHTSDWISMDDKAGAVRNRRESSAVVTARLASGKPDDEAVRLYQGADAMVDLSNTAVAMAAATLYIGRIKGVDRPTIAINVPGVKNGRVVLLDGGAVTDCTPENLTQFASLGSLYAKHVLGITEPRIGILSIGGEEGKGNALVKATTPLLAQSAAKGECLFVGNVEANDIFFRLADVVVADGFTGNCVLKAFEGVLSFIKALIREDRSLWIPALMSLPLYRNIKKKLTGDEYGGQPLLGLEGVCIIGHGNSNAKAVTSALMTARNTVASGIVGIIKKEFGTA